MCLVFYGVNSHPAPCRTRPWIGLCRAGRSALSSATSGPTWWDGQVQSEHSEIPTVITWPTRGCLFFRRLTWPGSASGSWFSSSLCGCPVSSLRSCPTPRSGPPPSGSGGTKRRPAWRWRLHSGRMSQTFICAHTHTHTQSPLLAYKIKPSYKT